MTPNLSHVAGLQFALDTHIIGDLRARQQVEEIIQQAKSAPAEPVSRESVEVVGWADESATAFIDQDCKQYGESIGGAAGSAVSAYTAALMTVAQHNRIVAALTPPSPDAELVELLREARELIEHGDFREGHCMCGSAVESHGFGDGHSPVDAGVYYAGQVMERIDAKMASLEVKP